MRIVIAEDSVLLRAGLTRMCSPTAGSRSSRPCPTPPSCSRRWPSTSRSWPSSTCGCRPPTPTRASRPPWSSAASTRTSPSWCCPSTSRRATPPTCSPRRAARSATCSRTGWRTCPTSWTRCAGSRRAAPSWTRRSSRAAPGSLGYSDDPMDDLTPREQQVLKLMAEGRSNTGIMETLKVSPSAVEKYVTNIFLKLDLPPTTTDHRRVLAVPQNTSAANPGPASPWKHVERSIDPAPPRRDHDRGQFRLLYGRNCPRS